MTTEDLSWLWPSCNLGLKGELGGKEAVGRGRRGEIEIGRGGWRRRRRVRKREGKRRRRRW